MILSFTSSGPSWPQEGGPIEESKEKLTVASDALETIRKVIPFPDRIETQNAIALACCSEENSGA